MKREDLIKQCRYYKGEKVNPYDSWPKANMWDYESVWVSMNLSEEGASMLDEYIRDYDYAGLTDYSAADGVPLSLKALLFGRFCHWSSGGLLDCVGGFKSFYSTCYRDGVAIIYR